MFCWFFVSVQIRFLRMHSTGSSTACWLNRASVYILLGIMMNLCLLTFDLHRIIRNPSNGKRGRALDWLACMLPMVLMVAGFIVRLPVSSQTRFCNTFFYREKHCCADIVQVWCMNLGSYLGDGGNSKVC